MQKDPRRLLDNIWAFPPNRETLGGTAYLIVGNSRSFLIDCPPWNDLVQHFLRPYNITHLVVTHRQAIAPSLTQIQNQLGCRIVIQEQEAYLLPEMTVTSFQKRLELDDQTQVIWTPGQSPGSACVYSATQGVLFSGRHLLPNQQGQPMPLRTAKTFHWRRQLQSLEALLNEFDDQTLRYICPGANTGFLRQQRWIENAYAALVQLDLPALAQAPIGL